MKMKFTSLLLFLLFYSTTIFSQLSNGSTAPNFTVTDLDGNTHTLYDYLDEGKTVVLDFSATWCGPCWNYHQTHVLEDLYNARGPNGTDEVMVLMIESDLGTSEPCIYGQSSCVGGTIGDWTVGVSYPIINLTSSNGPSVGSNFNINFYPTLYSVCPDRKTYEVGQPGVSTWYNWITSCSLEGSGQVTANENCYGENNGEVSLTTSGGYSSSSYSWSNGSTSQNLSGVGAGTYNVTVTEGQGHFIELGPFEVTGPSSAVEISVNNVTNVSCNGLSSGSILTSSSGGASGYSYQWNTGSSDPNISGLAGGTYTLTVTDANGCTDVEQATVMEPPVLTLSATPFNDNCGQGNGILLLGANGGNQGYTYDIGNGPTSSNQIFNLYAGTYTATVTDANGCTEMTSATIGNDPPPVANAGPSGTLDCQNPSTILSGSSSSSVSTFLWSTANGNIESGGNTATPTVNAAGTYMVQVTDVVTGCTAIDEVEVVDNYNFPNANAGTSQNLDCGTVEVTLNGSASSSGPNITYQWTTTTGNIVSGATTTNPIVNATGTYTLTVYNNANGCSLTDNVVVLGNNNVPTANAGPNGELNCNINSVTLNGSASSTGGTFTYQWTTTNGNITGGGTSLNPTVDASGTYVLVVTNTSNNCTSEASTIVNNNTLAPTADPGTPGTLTCATNSVQLDGSNSSGGSNLSYEWFDSNNNSISTNATATVNSSGNYSLVVTNNDNGCTDQSSATVSQNTTVPTASANTNGLIDCNNSTVTINSSGSTNGSFQWSDPSGANIGSGATVDVTLPGTYELIVTDNDNGCTALTTIDVDQNINEPTSSIAPAASITCTTSTVNLDGSASTSGNNISYEWVDQNGSSLGTGNNIDVSVAGDFTLIVTDNDNGCTSSSMESVTVDSSPPSVDPGSPATLNCANSMVTLDGSNSASGTNISYEWVDQNGNSIGTTSTVDVSNTGTYQLIVSDNTNGCFSTASIQVDENYVDPTANAGSPGQLDCTSPSVTLDGSASSTGSNFNYEWTDANGALVGNGITINVSAEGTYNLIVTNSDNGCTATSQVAVVASNDFPSVMVSGSSELNCAVQMVTLDGNGSSSGTNFEYQWLDNNGSPIGSNITVEVGNAGTYSLIVTNTSNGCSASSNYILNEDTNTPTAEANAVAPLDCSNTSTVIDGSGSSTGVNFSYEWQDAMGNVLGTDLTVEVSQAGTYTLIVVNSANGCSNSVNAEVTASADIPVANAGVGGTLNCNTASLILDGSGSSTGSEYSYEWTTSNGSIMNGGTSLNPNVNSGGTYQLTVFNNDNGCISTSEVVVTETPGLEIALENSSNVNCFGNNNGAASIEVSGGNGTYTYEWSNGASQASIENLTAGTYNVMVTDQDNCTATYSVVIDEPLELSSNTNTSNESSFQGNNGSATANPSGGAMGYSYLWSNGSTDATISNLAPGTYSVVITDANGCTTEETVTIEEFICTVASDVSSINVSCNGANDGQATASLTQGSGTPTFEWSNGATTSSVANLGAGTFTVVITDGNNCPSIQEITITEPAAINTSVIDVVDVICANATDGSATVDAQGGIGTLTYQWSTGAITATATGLSAGTYTATVTDGNFCSTTTSVEIIANDDVDPQAISQNITISLDSDGLANLSPMMVDNGSTDNCNISNIGLDKTQFDCSNLGMNEVMLTVTDGAGNTNSTMATITVIDEIGPSITCAGNVVSNSCNGVAYSLPTADDNCGTPTMELISGLASGEVFPEGTTEVIYKVTDASGNEATCTFTVTVENTLDIETMNDVMPSCNGDANGSLAALIGGGTAGYTYLWSNGQTTETATDLSAGTYTLLVTDATGCQLETTATLAEPEVLSAEYDISAPVCFGAVNGSITAMVDGGTEGYSFLWSDGQTSQTAINLEADTYSVLITDANGCEVMSADLIVDQPDELVLTLDNVTNATTTTSNDGSAEVTIEGGVGGYSYAWELNGVIISTDEDLTNAAPGDYLLTVTDDNGCVVVSNIITIEAPTSVIDPSLEKHITMMPNPTDGMFMIKLDLPQVSDVQVRIYDITGKEIMTSPKQSVFENQLEFNLASFTNGVYIVKVTVDDAVLAKRIVLQRF
ncbi:MAG: HYR domain-containing protein [Saprospiraceae bacterium]